MSVNVTTVSIKKSVTKAVDDYRNDPMDFVADYVAPAVNVNGKTGYLPRFNRLNQKYINFKVAPDAPSPRIDYGLGVTEFSCDVHRGVVPLPLELEEFDDTGLLNAANLGIQADEALRIEREREIAVLMANTGTFTHTNTSTPGTLWDATGGNPASDVLTIAKAQIHTNINRTAMYGLCTIDVAFFLQQFVADLRVGGGSAALATLPEVAAYMGLAEIRIASAGYDSTEPGDTSTAADIWGTKDFWVFHKPASINQFAPCFMATTRYARLAKARVWKENNPESFMIEAKDCYDLVDVDDSAGYFFVNVIS